MRAELIEDITKYDPAAPSNAQLRDDWRICMAWYSSIKRGLKFKFGADEVILVAKKIYDEITRRVEAGTMKHEFHPELMKPDSKELYAIVSRPVLYEIAKPKAPPGEEHLPIYPGQESEIGDWITLDEILDRFKGLSASLRNPFIYIVGSLANWGGTNGDIDILIRADKDEDIFRLIKWRLERAFPDLADRLHIFDDSWWAPFTCHVPIAALSVDFFSAPERVEMSAKSLKLMRWFPMLKPMHGRTKEEIYSIDSVLRIVAARKKDWYKTGIIVETKFDGCHVQVHKSKDQVKIITEDGTDVTRNCPLLVQEFKKISHDFVVCAEIELWKKGKHQPRADTAGVLNAKDVSPFQAYLRANIFDCVYFKEGQ